MERLPSDDMTVVDISTESTDTVTKSRRESFMDGIKDIQETVGDQDFKQKMLSFIMSYNPISFLYLQLKYISLTLVWMI